MISSDNFEVIDSLKGDGTLFEVLAYRSTIGNCGPHNAATLWYMHQTGVRYHQVRITLDDAEVRLQAGALHFMRGDITMETDAGSISKFFKRGLGALASGETIIKPVYRGTGEIFLEPSFGHFILVDIDDFPMICDDGMFFAADKGIEVTAHVQKKMSARIFGGEGWVQPKLAGKGVAVLESPIPFEEVVRVPLDDDTLKVDGSFAIARLGDIAFTVERSTKSLLGSAASGEGLLQTFRGTGEVWLNPTEKMFPPLIRPI